LRSLFDANERRSAETVAQFAGGIQRFALADAGGWCSGKPSAGCEPAALKTWRTILWAILRLVQDRKEDSTAGILDSRTIQSTPESGSRAGYDEAKRRKGSKVHAAVGTLGHLLAVKVTPANEQDRAQVKELAQAVQAATGQNVELAYVDQGCTGATGGQRRPAGNEIGSHQTSRGQKRIRAAASKMGGGTILWLGRAFADWRVTTNDWPPPWSVTIGLPSPSSCFNRSFAKLMKGSSAPIYPRFRELQPCLAGISLSLIFFRVQEQSQPHHS
jgi:hypothetical protein